MTSPSNKVKSPGHSMLGPSSAERWFNCPGSIPLIESLPPEAFVNSPYAAEGTVAHQLAEAYVKRELSLAQLGDKVGETVMQDGHEITIIEDMVNGAVEYDEAGEEARRQLAKPIAVIDQLEQRVHASSIDERIWGTADRVIYQKGHALFVIDYKFGKGVVEADRNKQMLAYAVAVEDSLAGSVFDRIVLGIVQPRARHSEGTTRWVEVSPAELLEFREELRAAALRTLDQKAPRVPGTWCRFCPALAYCHEAREGVEAAARTTFTRLPAPPSKEVGAREFLPDPAAFTSEQLARALEWEDSVDAWYEAVRTRALAELQRDPDAVPGFKLAEQAKHRAWPDGFDPETAFPLLGDKVWAKRKPLSPAQMEKIAGKDEVARAGAYKPQGDLVVVRTSDKREAVAASPRKLAEAKAIFGDQLEQELRALAAEDKPIRS